MLSIVALLAALAVATTGAVAGNAVHESARDIPVAFEGDVVVVGGSTWAVTAAVAAAEVGASVFLAAPRPYLGDDLAGTLRLTLEAGQELDDPLAKRIFGEGRSASPLTVKRMLDEALVQAGVEFLFGCFATDVLRDARGKPAGIVMANRAGRQAVVARVIVDATERGAVARLAGAKATPWKGGDHDFTRIVLVPGEGGDLGVNPVVEHVRLPMPDGSFRAFAAAEQAARRATYRDGQLRASESLFQVPPDRILGRDPATRDASHPSLDRFRPAGVDRLWVLGGCSDLPRDEMARLLRPAGLMQSGRQVGASAARMAGEIGDLDGVHLPETEEPATVAGDVREILRGIRFIDEPRATVPAASRALPILGRFDVVVIGGGTSGAPAAIGAGRCGARTLVVEYLEGLGGTGTLGLIGRPHRGLDIGFTREVPFPVERGAEKLRTGGVEHKMEWYRREIENAGGEIWLGAIGCGVVAEGNRVTGAVVVTPHGRGVALAGVVIDATGNADLAAAAGAETVFGHDAGDTDIALQGSGLPPRPLGRGYVNTDYLLVEESDLRDVWTALVGVRKGLEPASYDVGTLLHNRERQRIVGDHVLRYLDQIVGRTYPDTIVHSASNYDSHGYPSQPFFTLLPHDENSLRANHPAPGGSCFTPYRCLLPRNLDGMLVVGLGMSMERDASAMVRMQRDLQNQGYAAGVAAAMVACKGASTRELEVRALQEHLVAVGNLPAEVLDHRDSFPLDEADVAAAVEGLTQSDRPAAMQALAVVLIHREIAEPLLAAGFRGAQGADRLTHARILGFWGHAEVVPDLLAALDSVDAWDEKVLQGVMAEYAHLPTPVDALVLALGHTRDRRGLPAILRMLEKLDAETTLSHHRACALALESIADPAAAEPLARLLRKPGMRGHAMTSLEPLYESPDRRRREGALREIVLARALYRCGDCEGLGETILREYAADLRGLFARHARGVLDGAQ
jgi:flavin-dependent dehydrogenase